MFKRTAVLDLFDEPKGPADIIDAIDMHMNAYPDMRDLLIYYCGHGGFMRNRNYFLTLTGTRKDREASTGLKLRELRHDLENKLINRRLYMILDCCYAGEAVKEFMFNNVDKAIEDEVMQALPSHGWTMLVAASPDGVAMAPTGRELTMFTEALTHVLTSHEIGAGRALSLAEITYESDLYIRRTHGLKAVRPQCHSPRQDAGDLAHSALFVNVANPHAPRVRTLIEPTPSVTIEPQSPPVPPRSDNLTNLPDGLPQDDREAAHLYKLAADQGEASAQYHLGVFYSTGRGGLAKDDREAARLYKLAADRDTPTRRTISGILRGGPWRPGEGRPRGRAPLQARRRPGRRLGAEQSRVLLRAAVAAWRRTTARPRASTSSPLTRETPPGKTISGSSTRTAVAACRRTIARPRASTSSPLTRETPRADQSRVLLRARPWRLTKDDREAARLYKLAADQGNAAGAKQSRDLLRAGRGGLPKDDREAARLYKLAADQGNASAQNNLGVFYAEGRGGLPKDDREAARLYKLAADQGNAAAQYNLGVFYAQGRGGLPKDDREAARLYKLAADQGNASAQYNLGVFYRGPWRSAEGRPRGRAPLQARR